MGKTPEQILSDIRSIQTETDPHDITAPRLGEVLEDMLVVSKDIKDKTDSLPVPSDQNYKGKITVSDLLSLSGMGSNDLYLVYSAGSDEEGWSEGDTFELNGSTYSDGTFVQWMGSGWRAVSDTDVNISKTAIFDPQPDKIYVVARVFPQTSYDHLYGRSKSGMTIAEVESYQLDAETGTYKPVVERTTGQYAGQTNRKTIVVPYAHSYQEGGTTHYKGGVLADEDYRQLKEFIASGSLFFATFGRTTLAEIRDAVQAGKEVLMLYGSIMYRLTMLAGSRAVFFSANDRIVREAEVDSGNDWSVEEFSLTGGSDKMETDASNAETDAVQNLLDALPYTSGALTGDDSLVMKIDDADAYKEVPITSLADYIAAPVLASPGSGSISDWDGRLVYQSAGAQRRISAVLSPITVNALTHSAGIGNSTASGDYSFAAGYNNTASGNYSFAAGQNNTASNGSAACLGGSSNTASGQGAACIGGSSSTASAMYAVASGFYALADYDHMMAIGKYSRGWTASCAAHGISAAGSDYLLLTVGSGSGPNARKNSFEVWSTDEAYIGDRGVSTLYTITIEGTDSDSYPSSVAYGKGLESQGYSFTGDWNVFFAAINCDKTAKASVSEWLGSHVFTVFYHDLDSDNIYSSPSDIGLTLGFHQSGAIWLPQVNLTDKTFFKDKNYKCVIQFSGR